MKRKYCVEFGCIQCIQITFKVSVKVLSLSHLGSSQQWLKDKIIRLIIHLFCY